ncbi:VWA domain-containing protein [Arsenicibacter rosenii]|uniref:VWFA domain-containing protein n=1 Tax=Arsenicibacter rosenii TaxID=1750698 RepID=A0A1S2VDT3_9BACT|nr:VWA domain-containing protein [Arsenicibacter rosenii]OIN56884.1 hypothetical protein BLX24_22210 [Arsenicibacter rosenii]
MEPWYSIDWFTIGQWQQFRFANSWILYTIPALPLLFLFRYLLSQGRSQKLNVSTGTYLYVNSLLGWLRFITPIAFFTGISLILVALARPQIVKEQRIEQSDGIDIMLALDVSSSMTETDLAPNRLAAARQMAQMFVKGRKNDRIGLVVFAGEAFSLCPLTTDYALLDQYIADLRENMIPTTGTAIGDALARCINRMRETEMPALADTASKKRTKVVILLSDGENTAGNLDPVTAAKLGRAFGIRIYTIAVGKVEPVAAARRDSLPDTPAVATSAVDEGVLKSIARIGNGSYFRATDAKRLETVFKEIDRLEKAPVRTQVYEHVQDFYRIYLYWAICFLLFTLFLKNTILANILED